MSEEMLGPTLVCPHHPAPWWSQSAYLGRVLLLNQLQHRLEEMSFSSTTNCGGSLCRAEDAQIYQPPPADVLTADPSPMSGPPMAAEGAVHHKAVTSGPSSHTGRETAGENEQPDLSWVTMQCVFYFQKN